MSCRRFLLPLLFAAAAAHGQLPMLPEVTQALDRAGEALTWESADGKYYAAAGGQVDLTEYYLDGQPYGLLYSNPSDHFFLAPRLTLTGEAAYGDRLFAFVKFRWDNGVDPGFDHNDVRVDELFLRVSLVPRHLDVQAGKFATVFGGWAGRQGGWENPLITAPLPYDQMTSVTDGAAPPSAAAFANRRNRPDNLNTWTPVIWGPVYLPSAAVLGTYEQWDLALAGTTQALSARPDTWSELDFSRPSFTGRLGWRPGIAWNLGVSGSVGPYLTDAAAGTLPPGAGLSAYDQITVGGDLTWQWRQWEVFGEFIFSRFEVPTAGNADTFSWYLQAKYKITSQLFAAVRWNQQVYNQVNTATGPQDWDNNLLRLDLGLGYKWDTHILTKIEYSWQHQDASFQNGRQLVALQLIVRF